MGNIPIFLKFQQKVKTKKNLEVEHFNKNVFLLEYKKLVLVIFIKTHSPILICLLKNSLIEIYIATMFRLDFAYKDRKL